jgi:hypothetical protein
LHFRQQPTQFSEPSPIARPVVQPPFQPYTVLSYSTHNPFTGADSSQPTHHSYTGPQPPSLPPQPVFPPSLLTQKDEDWGDFQSFPASQPPTDVAFSQFLFGPPRLSAPPPPASSTNQGLAAPQPQESGSFFAPADALQPTAAVPPVRYVRHSGYKFISSAPTV